MCVSWRFWEIDPAQVESLLHSLERAAGGIGLHVNADKTAYMCFNQSGDISILNGGSLKLVDKFTYLESNVSSIEITSIRDERGHGQLSTGYRSYGSQTYLIK